MEEMQKLYKPQNSQLKGLIAKPLGV